MRLLSQAFDTPETCTPIKSNRRKLARRDNDPHFPEPLNLLGVQSTVHVVYTHMRSISFSFPVSTTSVLFFWFGLVLLTTL